MDVDARIQLFDLKTQYQFQTTPGVDQYNMPLYDLQIESPDQNPQSINMYPVYQGFLGPAYINGIQVNFQTQKEVFFNSWPNVTQQMQAIATGNGSSGPYTFTFPISPGNSAPINPPVQSILRGHVDMTGIISTGNNIDPPLGTTLYTSIPSTSIYPAVYITSISNQGSSIVIQDSGQFLNSNVNYGLLMSPGTAPFGYSILPGGYTIDFPITGATQANPCVLTCTSTFSIGQIISISGVGGMTELNDRTFTVTSVSGTTVTIDVDSTGFTAYTAGGTASSLQNMINYLTGTVTNLFFPSPIPDGATINAQCLFFQSGLPRGILFNNNTLTLRSPPDRQYLVQLDAYLSPAAYLNSASAIQFAYMSEYIARGAARKILSDTGDVEQFQFYEQFFREQEILVWKRSQRQFSSTRTQTIYSQGSNQGISGNNLGGNIL